MLISDHFDHFVEVGVSFGRSFIISVIVMLLYYAHTVYDSSQSEGWDQSHYIICYTTHHVVLTALPYVHAVKCCAL